MKLYCMRHGEALPVETNPECPLSAHGREDVVRIARYLTRQGVDIKHIYHSNKLRAQQTAEIMAHSVNPDEITQCQFELDATQDLDPMLSILAHCQQSTLLVGHLPFLPKLISQLVLGNEDELLVSMPPATIICLTPQDPKKWVIEWMLTPSIVTS